MPATLDLESAPTDSTLGMANAVRKAYLALAEVAIDHAQDVESADAVRDIGAASARVLEAEAALRAHLKRQAEEDGF